MPIQHPQTVDELTKSNIEAVTGLEHAAQAKRTRTDHIVDAITAFCGHMAFVWVHVAWFGIWILINLLPGLPHQLHFDPYPFQLLTLVVSLEAIFLSTFILISQNRQSGIADLRNHLDLQINLLAEQENTKALRMLAAIQKHLGVPDGDPEVSVLEEATQPERLMEQIEQAVEHK